MMRHSTENNCRKPDLRAETTSDGLSIELLYPQFGENFGVPARSGLRLLHINPVPNLKPQKEKRTGVLVRQ
jgi:hypothetical protein